MRCTQYARVSLRRTLDTMTSVRVWRTPPTPLALASYNRTRVQARPLQTTACRMDRVRPGAQPSTTETVDTPIGITFRNEDGAEAFVTLAAIAGQLTDETRLYMPDVLVPPDDQPDGTPVRPEWATVPRALITESERGRVYTLSCSAKALEALKEYAEWPRAHRHTKPIPQPMDKHIAVYITPEELAFIKRCDDEGVVVELLEAAVAIHHDSLAELCAAFISVRVDEIAKAAPSIMEGAERIRNYLGLKNEWTEEEMKHLENEMKVLKEIDPNAY